MSVGLSLAPGIRLQFLLLCSGRNVIFSVFFLPPEPLQDICCVTSQGPIRFLMWLNEGTQDLEFCRLRSGPECGEDT